ncbi:MAG: MFS transporter [Deltaproteobacteria bacterium]|nr:MFS transporter [Deltaproteobacteria bacterium]
MPPEQPPQYNYDRRHIVIGLVVLFLIYGTMAYFMQALNIARPKIAADLDGMSIYAWSVSIAGLVGAFVTLIFGKLSDIYGRRIMLLISIAFALAGSILSILSTTFVFFIIATAIGSVGIGAMMPLVFAVVGDMFPPVERSKWVGMLQLPMGIAALFGPALGGYFADTAGWRYFFWSLLPLLILSLILVPFGVPPLAHRGTKYKIDLWGCLLVIVASSTTIIGISLDGVAYPWTSAPRISLLGIALISWIFFFRVEYSVEEPILDPLVLRNRCFNTVVVASSFSFFGQMGMMMYFPMFLQGVQGISATISGWIFTPYGVLMAFVGVPVGFMLARYRRYKWMYIAGFGILTITMFCVLLLSEDTPILFSVIVSTLAGLGLGAIPTVNTMVIQNTVPKRLLGAAMGASFFCMMMALAVAPAILGTAERTAYAKALAASIPDGLDQVVGEKTMASRVDSQVLLSKPDMTALENTFKQMGEEGEALFHQTVDALRTSMLAGLRSVFWIGAILMLFSFLIIITVPEIPIGSTEENPDS